LGLIVLAGSKRQLKRAVLWVEGPDRKAQCNLCNHRCLIAEGRRGLCRVRENIGGVLYSLNYDRVCAASDDPIEKKPLFHFQPGTRSFSISAPGCNFRCEFCQNWHISQVDEQQEIEGQPVTPQAIVSSALRTGCKSIAHTYTEPTIFMELCAECGKLAKQKSLANVFVSNGFMTIEAVDFTKDWLDAINIDLKAFSEDYYKRLCKARLGPVLDTIRYIAKHTDIWLEITTLIVPGENDSDEELRSIAELIATEAGPDVPWHVSRFYPTYRMTDREATPVEAFERAERIGKDAGLRYIYPGNMPGSKAECTFCYSCGQMLIERAGYNIGKNLIEQGTCPKCKTNIAGVDL